MIGEVGRQRRCEAGYWAGCACRGSGVARPLGGAIASALALPAIAGTVIGAGIAIGGSFHVSAARTVNFQFKEFDNVGS